MVYADPPWMMWGDPNKDAAAAKHYALMEDDDVFSLPIRQLFDGRGVLFLWATCPRLDVAIEAISRWGLHYRGVAYVWVKTRKDGTIISGQGVRPTLVKPTVELCLAATTHPSGRPLPLLTEGQGQVVLAPRGRHSAKPPEVRKRIEELLGDVPRIELFAREAAIGWDSWGNELDGFRAKDASPR